MRLLKNECLLLLFSLLFNICFFACIDRQDPLEFFGAFSNFESNSNVYNEIGRICSYIVQFCEI